MTTILTGITGGIGSGKSVVCRILSAMGYDVYDCDLAARHIMDTDDELKHRLCIEIHPEAVDRQGIINRQIIAATVFADAEALQRLNDIVHHKVRSHLRQWIEERKSSADRLFVESAIMHTSSLDTLMDCIWEVTAPTPLRIERIMCRNGMSAEEAMRRINSQSPLPAAADVVIINDEHTSLLRQVLLALHP